MPAIKAFHAMLLIIISYLHECQEDNMYYVKC